MAFSGPRIFTDDIPLTCQITEWCLFCCKLTSVFFLTQNKKIVTACDNSVQAFTFPEVNIHVLSLLVTIFIFEIIIDSQLKTYVKN